MWISRHLLLIKIGYSFFIKLMNILINRYFVRKFLKNKVFKNKISIFDEHSTKTGEMTKIPFGEEASGRVYLIY